MSNNIELKYQSLLTVVGNGTIEQTIKTPFGVEFSEIQQIFIEQSPTSVKRLSIYPNGCVVYMEHDAHKALVKTNWPIEKDKDGNLVIVEPK